MSSSSTPSSLSVEEKVAAIFEVFSRRGADPYFTEPVTHIEHALQAGDLARQGGFDNEVIIAALLHDIGHICAPDDAPHMDTDGGPDVGVMYHEKVGADFLRAYGFSEKIALLVESHVHAKRYLTFKTPEYHDNLAHDSVRSLKFQGGPMTEDEAQAYESQPLPLDLKTQMR